MADYRLSAQVIKRSEGRSSVASSAYRAGVRMVDERTGDIHDYSRKGGVLHTEILAPKNTPDVLLLRQELWNAVEQVERRKDAQLAREIQLSLPHELAHSQQLELVREFVQEQFVERGMIADMAIHAPNKAGDERNYHAHIMLTMRETSSNGFGKKVRAWNDREAIGIWREAWAMHQNRELEKHGHESRVDHRSYSDRGIDQEPTQHRGNSATEMEQKGITTRIGEKNRQIETRNAEQARNRAMDALLTAQIGYEKACNDPHHESAQVIKFNELHQRQEKEKKQLNAQIVKELKPSHDHLQEHLARISSRLENASGIRKALRNVLGITRHDERLKNKISMGLKAVQLSVDTKLRTLEIQHTLEQQRHVDFASTQDITQNKSGWGRDFKRATQPTNDNENKRGKSGWFKNQEATRERKP